MIPVDLSANSANCEGRIYGPNGSGIQILGIRYMDPFSGSTDMSVPQHCLLFKKQFVNFLQILFMCVFVLQNINLGFMTKYWN